VKFPVDAQLPNSISELLKQFGYDSMHTTQLPSKNATTDHFIIELATEEQRVVILKDADFLESYIISGKPPKLIIVKTGNVSNKILLQLFETNLSTLITMISRSNLVEISTTEIAEHD
jgi:predicted nuclease of predicted toxin-antitoxin system